MSEAFDVVVIGAGPAGLAAGAQAAVRGMSTVVLERGRLADTVHRYQKAKHVMAEPERLPLHGDLPLRFEAGSREEVLAAWAADVEAVGANIRVGADFEVKEIEGGKGSFRLTLASGNTLSCASVVLAIGVQGNLRRFGVPGDDLPFVSYQLDDPADHTGERVLVIGAGDAGIENALALADHDNDVTIVNRREEFDRAKAQNRSLIEAAIRSGRVAYYPNSAVDHFETGRVILRTEGGTVALEVDLVIGRLGATPPRRFLESIGIEFPNTDADSVPQVTPSYESNVPGIFVLGALAGYPLIKNCMNQGYEVIEHILGNRVVPADEPLLAEKFGRLEGDVSQVLERIRTEIPLFGGLNSIQLRELLIDAEVHTPADGEVVYERNDFSDSFYAILEGSVEALIPMEDAQRDTDSTGEIELRPVSLGKGEFFGEGSLISGRRRFATIRAKSDCVAIEIPRFAMNRLIHSVADVKRVLDRAFISRHLSDLIPEVDTTNIDYLVGEATINVYPAGEEIFHQGDPPDGLHLIRRGAVTISVERAGREVMLQYVQAGNLIGEMAVLSPGKARSATVRASVLTETIRLPYDAITAFLERNAGLRERLQTVEAERIIENVARLDDRPGTDLVRFLMDAGAGEATDLLLVDESLCIRCDNCEKACSETHGGVSRLDREAGPTIGTVHIPTACRHCENPKCMTDCPPDVIRRHPNGEIFIMDGCIGCGNCVAYCPYDVIQLEALSERPRRNILLEIILGAGSEAGEVGGEKVAVKCDLCRKLPQPSTQKRSACVESCPTGAIIRVDPREYVNRVLDSGA